MAWKKQRPKSSFLNSFGFVHVSKNLGFEIGSTRNEPIKLALSPFGGSFVILTPPYKIAGGKAFDG